MELAGFKVGDSVSQYPRLKEITWLESKTLSKTFVDEQIYKEREVFFARAGWFVLVATTDGAIYKIALQFTHRDPMAAFTAAAYAEQELRPRYGTWADGKTEGSKIWHTDLGDIILTASNRLGSAIVHLVATRRNFSRALLTSAAAPKSVSYTFGIQMPSSYVDDLQDAINSLLVEIKADREGDDYLTPGHFDKMDRLADLKADLRRLKCPHCS